MDKSIRERLDEYLEDKFYPFHMPGHKGRNAFVPGDLFRYDVTELPDMDNLHNPTGMIKEAQKRIADIYGAEESFLLVNGSTAGLIAAVAAVCPPAKSPSRIMIDRASHKSVYSGLVFSGAEPVYVIREQTPYNFTGGIIPNSVEKAFMENGDIAAICITSPTYEGIVSDIRSIADIAHAHNACLIVDEAHGAHFPFHEAFPISAVALGADVVINSLHKTLPLPSQCAVLHVSGSRVDRQLLKRLLAAVQTSSPSYMFMTLMDYITGFLWSRPDYFDTYVRSLNGFRKNFPKAGPIELLCAETAIGHGITDIDIGKLTFCIAAGDLTGYRLEEALAQHGLRMEMSGPTHVVAMTSVADDAEGFYKLSKAMQDIMEDMPLCEPVRKSAESLGFYENRTEMCYTPGQAFYMNTAEVDIERSIGMIAGDFVIPYPPGIPLLVPGERITVLIAETIRELLDNMGNDAGRRMLGVDCMKVRVLK